MRAMLKVENMELKLVSFVLGLLSALYVKSVQTEVESAREELEKLKVSVFYETYCPCSTLFLKKQLIPAYWSLRSHVEVDLVPFGHVSQNYANGSWELACKHGEEKCFSNKIHACVIKHGKNQEDVIGFINCFIDEDFSEDILEICAQFNEMSGQEILKCANGPEGEMILSQFANRTGEHQFGHIPTIVFNDLYDRDLDDAARKSFLKTVCSLFKERAPSSCGIWKLDKLA